jgi:sarcosine oxidase subunit beta
VARELLRRAAERGVDVREHVAAEDIETDLLVIACGPWSAELGAAVGIELPVRPLCRQLLETSPLPELPEDLPMVIEAETGFHFRRRDDRLLVAMADPAPRWTAEATVDASLFDDRLDRLVARYPPAAGATIENAWAGLYDMTPDAHPIVGRVADGVYAACGFSGHGFMQSPAVGRALAEEILRGESSLDLRPYALERFEHGAAFPERLVL